MSVKQKTATILSCVYTSEWKNPSGSLTYYHKIAFDNGDVGDIGSAEKNPSKLAPLQTIVYEIDENKSKVKYIETPGAAQSNNFQQVQGKKTNQNRSGGGRPMMQKSQADYLGFAWGYAKDLVIAGKTLEDFENMDKLASAIYDRIGEMLNGSKDDMPF